VGLQVYRATAARHLCSEHTVAFEEFRGCSAGAQGAFLSIRRRARSTCSQPKGERRSWSLPRRLHVEIISAALWFSAISFFLAGPGTHADEYDEEMTRV